tara:strand:+ start:4174 stop:6336 length:2163 start_codon:yes stop_codon:yes gene_type:complete
MAVLGKIRSLGPVALISVIGLALFAFVFSTGSGTVTDVFKADEFNQSRVAVVNGIEMDRSDFMRSVDNSEQQNRGSRTSIQTMNSVWDTELKKLILKSEFNKIGIDVEREMMRDFLKTNLQSFNDFLNENGEFDEQKLNQFISNLKEISPETLELQGSLVNYESWNNFEESIADQGIEFLYYRLIDAGLFTSRLEAEEDYFNSNDVVDFKYVSIPFDLIPDSEINISKSEVTDFINKNQSEYSSEPGRDFIYVKFEEKPSLDDELETKKRVEELLNDREEYDINSQKLITYKGFKNTTNNEDFINSNSAIKFFDSYVFKNSLTKSHADKIYDLKKGEIYGPYVENGLVKATKLIDSKFIPDSVKVRHILIPYIGSFRSDPTTTKSKNEAKKTADSIFRILKINRNKFISLLPLSSDEVSNEKNGEIEFAYIDGFAPEFRDFSFEKRVGSIEIVETDFGFHIIEILSQSKKQKAIKVGNLAFKIEPSEKTRDSVYNIASKFEIAVDKDNFREYAAENTFKVNPVNNIGELDENIPILGKQRSIVRWSYEDNTEVGDIKKFNLSEGGYVIAMLTSINDDGMMSYEKSSIVAIPKLKDQKKAQKIIKDVNFSNLDEIASKYDLNVQTSLSVNLNNPVISGVGNEPSVVGYAMGYYKEVISPAIIGNMGVFFIYVTDRRKASSLNNYMNIINKISSTRSSQVRLNAYNALKDKAEIEDYRSTFY